MLGKTSLAVASVYAVGSADCNSSSNNTIVRYVIFGVVNSKVPKAYKLVYFPGNAFDYLLGIAIDYPRVEVMHTF